MNKTVWSIGHSTHSLEEFILMLQASKIEVVTDIRSYPGSRRYPHFNKENLFESLKENKIMYYHLEKLGGRRKPNPDSRNTAWRHPAFRSYADYMETQDFRLGINGLEKIASLYKTAYMCSEAVWWKCHRSMVSDFMKARGWEVRHIMGAGKETEHVYTEPAKLIEDGVNYV